MVRASEAPSHPAPSRKEGQPAGGFALQEAACLRSGSMVFIFRAIKTECKSTASGHIQNLKVFVLLSREIECQVGFVKWQSN